MATGDAHGILSSGVLPLTGFAKVRFRELEVKRQTLPPASRSPSALSKRVDHTVVSLAQSHQLGRDAHACACPAH